MASIKINLKGVRDNDSSLQAARKEISSTRNAVCGTVDYINPQIKRRKNLDGRLSAMIRNLDLIQNKINRISTVTMDGVNSYQTVENRAVRKAKELTSLYHLNSATSDSVEGRR